MHPEIYIHTKSTNSFDTVKREDRKESKKEADNHSVATKRKTS